MRLKRRIQTELYRVRNTMGRLWHRLPLHGESVWAGAPTDLFQAHLSIYEFCAQRIQGLKVLDAGCGTGYGCALLKSRGAARVLGIDQDPWSIRYAARRYRQQGLEFHVGDLQELSDHPDERFDRIIASNVLEHLPRPSDFLAGARSLLAPGGVLWVAVPPIVDEASLAANRANPYHLTNLSVAEWSTLFSFHGYETRPHRHLFLGEEPDFTSPLPSRRPADSFVVVPSSLEDFYREPCLGAVFALRITGGPAEAPSKRQP